MSQDLKLTSPAFKHHERIPDGTPATARTSSPALEWSGVPEGTKAFAVVVHDPDAPLVDGFTHWVAYGIPGDATGLPEGGGRRHRASTRWASRATAAPPRRPSTAATTTTSGSTRSTRTRPRARPGPPALLDAIEDHVIEQARLVGTFSH